MGILQLCTCKLTHLARIIISERMGKITPNDGVVILPAPIPFLEGVILPHLKNLKLPPKNV